MVLLDVNVLVYAFREDAPRHAETKRWLDQIVSRRAPFGLSELVLSGFLRVVTHARVFDPPTPLDDALGFVDALRERSNCLIVRPQKRHWQLFVDLCRSSRARGNLIPDAYHAALAIESGSEWITTDRDFARFPGLTWAEPKT
jgi:uncharacterized protein